MQKGREKCTVQFLKCVPDTDPYIMAGSMSDLGNIAADTENIVLHKKKK